MGEYREATRYYEKATELKPDSSRSWSNLGAAYLYTGRFEASVPLFERALEIADSASTRSNLGTALYYLGRYEESVENYRSAVELQPDHAIHRANLGDALLKLNRDEEARDAYRKAADLALVRAQREPLSPDVQNDLALYCAKAGDETCALRAARTAAELQPRSAKIAFNNAVVRCVLRLDGPCLEWLERAVKLGTTRSEIQAQPELERLADHPGFRDILELAP
jgi:Flp pilus assembly protein TadD